MDYDVIVVGAGIGGATAAYELGRRGLRVLVLERQRLPRYKACGGGVGRRVLESFPFPLDHVIEDEIHEARASFRGWGYVRHHLADRPVVTVMRDKLDYAVLQQARADVRDGVTVTAVREACPACPERSRGERSQRDEAGVTVETASETTYRARYVVGADGAGSCVARSLGLRRRARMGVALEAEVPVLPGDATLRRWHGAALFLFGTMSRGYLWVFPKRDHLSVGIGTLGRPEHPLREHLRRQMARLGIDVGDAPMHGHPLPICTRNEPLQSRRCVLVGDAAGLLDPLTGEGIRHAIHSARLAADAIAAGDLYHYTRLVQIRIGAALRQALGLAYIFYYFPFISFQLAIRNRFITPDFARMLNGELDYADLMLRLPKYLVGVLGPARTRRLQSMGA